MYTVLSKHEESNLSQQEVLCTP